MNEETTFDYTAWKAKQTRTTFRVVTGNGEIIRLEAHDPNIDSPQPVLRFLVYSNQTVEVEKVTGGKQNKKISTAEEEHTVAEISGAYNAGAWVSFVDEKYLKGVTKLDAIQRESDD